MFTPAFIDGQFVDGTLLNGAVTQLMNDFEMIGSELHTPGLLNPSSLVFTAPSGMNVGISAPSPFAVLFGTGLLVGANGIVNGATSSSYAVNLASLVPTSGAGVTVYIVAGYFGSIGEQQIQVVGPPTGHPDYDPTFAPFQFYTEGLDTLSIAATTTPPNNSTTFELARTVLTVGQSTINPSNIVSGTNWHYASAVLNPTGAVPGTYAGATVTVSGDGRITAVSGVAYGPLGANNTWTGNNTFTKPLTVTDTGTGGLVVNGAGNASGANIKLTGNGATTPNKFIRALNGIFNIVNSAYTIAILTLTDAGDFSVTGGIGAGGVINSNGDITAVNGRLRASYGARDSGDASAATTLNDFLASFSSLNNGFMLFPNNFMIQICTTNVATVNGTARTTVNLPRPFVNNIAGAWVCLVGTTPPESYINVSADPASSSSVLVTTTFSAVGTAGVIVIALGV